MSAAFAGELIGATLAMAVFSMLIGWLIRRFTSITVFSGRAVGLVVMVVVAPFIYMLGSDTSSYTEPFVLYLVGGLIAGVIFLVTRSKTA